MGGSTGHLVPDLEYRHHARQVTAMVAGDAAVGRFSRVLSLKGSGPLSADLPRGSEILVQSRRGLLPPSGWSELLRWLRSDPPAEFHIWGRSALRAYSAIKSFASKPRNWLYSPLVGEVIGRFERVALTGCSEIVVPHANIAGLGNVPSRMLDPLPSRSATIAETGKTSDTRTIVSVGRMDRTSAFRDAIWAFDILSRADPSLNLVMIGDGPARESLREFAALQVRNTGKIHFLGADSDPYAHLRQSILVWIPNDPAGGLHRLREAVNLGRPVVVPRLPHLVQSLPASQIVRFYRPGCGADLATASAELIW